MSSSDKYAVGNYCPVNNFHKKTSYLTKQYFDHHISETLLGALFDASVAFSNIATNTSEHIDTRWEATHLKEEVNEVYNLILNDKTNVIQKLLVGWKGKVRKTVVHHLPFSQEQDIQQVTPFIADPYLELSNLDHLIAVPETSTYSYKQNCILTPNIIHTEKSVKKINTAASKKLSAIAQRVSKQTLPNSIFSSIPDEQATFSETSNGAKNKKSCELDKLLFRSTGDFQNSDDIAGIRGPVSKIRRSDSDTGNTSNTQTATCSSTSLNK